MTSRPHTRDRKRAFRNGVTAIAIALVPLVAVGSTPASAAVGELPIADLCSLRSPAVPAWTTTRSGAWLPDYETAPSMAAIGCGSSFWGTNVFEGIQYAPQSGAGLSSTWRPGLPILSAHVKGQVLIDYSDNPGNTVGGWQVGVRTDAGGSASVELVGLRPLDSAISGNRSTQLETYASCNNPGGTYAGRAWCTVPGQEEFSALIFGSSIVNPYPHWWQAEGPAKIDVVLADDYAPRASISSAPSGDWTGNVTLQFDASDRMPGGGVQRASFVVDGVTRSTADLSRDTVNESTCNPSDGNFKALPGCPEEATTVFSLGTAAMPDGVHTVNALVADASGRSSTVIGWPRDVVFANKPVLTADPAPTGRIQVGNTIAIGTGSWSSTRAPRGFTYQWTLDGEPLDGQTQPTTIPTLDWAYRTLSVTVTASNTGGSTSTTVPLGRVADANGYKTEEEARRALEERRGSGGTPPIATSLPGISGTLQVGRGALAATVGGWAGATSHDIRWWRCARSAQAFSTSSCAPVGSGATYTLGSDDQYSRLAIVVTGRNDAGTAQTFSPVSAIVKDKDGLTEPREDRSTGRTGGGGEGEPTLPGTNEIPPGVAARVVPVWPAGVEGLINPLAERGHVANGINATAAPKWSGVTIKVNKKKRSSSVVGKAGRRWTIVGKLANGNKAIGGATLNVITDSAGKSTATGTVKTAKDGTFKATITATTSRSVRLAYFGYGDTVAPSLSSAVKVAAYAPTKIGVGARVARNGGKIRITGTVGTKTTAKSGTVVTVQLKQAGYKWMPIGTATTDATGKWNLDYTARKGLPPRSVSIRAVIPDGQTGSLYARTITRSVGVSIK